MDGGVEVIHVGQCRVDRKITRWHVALVHRQHGGAGSVMIGRCHSNGAYEVERKSVEH
jgi:hypothetical protein